MLTDNVNLPSSIANYTSRYLVVADVAVELSADQRFSKTTCGLSGRSSISRQGGLAGLSDQEMCRKSSGRLVS